MVCTCTGMDKPTLKLLNLYVRDHIAPQWYDFGIQLLENEYVTHLDVIEKNHHGDTERCCTEMFKYWLSVDTEATWNKLTEALEGIGKKVLAKDIKGIVKGVFNNIVTLLHIHTT